MTFTERSRELVPEKGEAYASCPEKVPLFLPLTSPNADRFSKFFHRQT